jgi:hypothetical protein
VSRKIVDDVLGPAMTREIWTGNYFRALPITLNDFELSAVLPAVFYMFRRGQRRGKGRFLATYGPAEGSDRERRRSVTIDVVSTVLSESKGLESFKSEVGTAILGDLLLCYCLENVKHSLGRGEQVQRGAPTHYMASWIDLPDDVANLRSVPEMIVALLANQGGEYVKITEERTWFAVGKDFKENALLKVFHTGVKVEGEYFAVRGSDRFVESTPVGIDQLLTIRLAQKLGQAPDKLRGRGGESIPNQRPIAERASRHFSEDIRRFVRSYAQKMPRHALVPMLESCMAVGLTTILTTSIEILLDWAQTGEIPAKTRQVPTPLLFDCSSGVDTRLRALSEQSFEDFVRRMSRFPVLLMCLRLLDHAVSNDPNIEKVFRTQPESEAKAVSTFPFATEWIDLLGAVLYQRHEQSAFLHYSFDQKATSLAKALKEDSSEAATILEDRAGYPNHIWRVAEALTVLMGRKNTLGKLLDCLNSSTLVDRPNGLAARRRVRTLDSAVNRKTREIRSLVLTDSVLDYLVHLHLLCSGDGPGFRALSYKEFLRTIRDRYGFCVDEAPRGMTISNDLLQTNRKALERRLRDLGLLEGVNDAEQMKRLTPRFESSREENDDAD